jgi:hypothetical protein
MWDFGPSRATTDLPDRHEAVVHYQDSSERQLPELRSILDWGAYNKRRWVEVYSIHDAAKALREIGKTMLRRAG